MLQSLVIVLQVISAIVLIALVLLQQGKSADASASFGGASQTVFGSGGTGSFLANLTGIFAAIFFVASLGLAYLAKNGTESHAGFDLTTAQEESVKAAAEAKKADEKKAVLSAELPKVNADVQAQTQTANSVETAPVETVKAVAEKAEQKLETKVEENKVKVEEEKASPPVEKVQTK